MCAGHGAPPADRVAEDGIAKVGQKMILARARNHKGSLLNIEVEVVKVNAIAKTANVRLITGPRVGDILKDRPLDNFEAVKPDVALVAPAATEADAAKAAKELEEQRRVFGADELPF